NGIIKPGETINPDEPLVLLAKEREHSYGQITRSKKSGFSDSSLTWDHHNPGIVTDVVPTRHGVNVVVKSYAKMEVGDKLCYDEETEILTKEGWQPISLVANKELVNTFFASLAPDNSIEYLQAIGSHAYPHDGLMYSIETDQVSLLVTDHHQLYARVHYYDYY